MSSFSFAVHNYMIAYGLRFRNHYSIIMPEAFSLLAFSIAYHIYFFYQQKPDSGSYFDKKKSPLYK